MHRVLLAIVSACFVLACVFFGGVSAGSGDAPQAPCPVSLSNPDGQALEIERFDLRAAVHGPLALVEMEMVFRNPQDRQMEGRFLYLLPPGATVSRFAKEVDGKLMEGEVVERQRARSVYREILHTMRDPALLEQDQGNRFSAKVFPIPAKGTTRLVLSYSQVLPAKAGKRTLTIPLAGMPEIKDFSMDVLLAEWPGERAARNQSKDFSASETKAGTRLVRKSGSFKPEEDFVVDFEAAQNTPEVRAVKSGSYQMLAYRPAAKPAAKPEKMDWVFYIDTSASNADTEKRRNEAFEALEGLLWNDKFNEQTLSEYVFDIDVENFLGPMSIAQLREKALQSRAGRLAARHALGATDLAKALKHIGENARAEKKAQRFVLVGDGIATWGKREPAEILAKLGDWPENDTLHALVLGPKQDAKMLEAITAKTRGRVVTVNLGESMEANVREAMDALQRPVGQSFEFYDEGAKWIYPKTFRDVQPGDELVVFSELKDGVASAPGAVLHEGSKKSDTPLKAAPAEAPGFAPLLQREAVAAKLAHLEKQTQDEQIAKDAKRMGDLRKQIVETSVANRVLCGATALLVLESEADYDRFGLDRKALRDVMVVGASGIEWKHRTAADLALKPAPEPAKPAAPAKKAERGEEGKDGKPDEAGGKLLDAALELQTEELSATRDEQNVDGHVPMGSGNPFAAVPAARLTVAGEAGEGRERMARALETRDAAIRSQEGELRRGEDQQRALAEQNSSLAITGGDAPAPAPANRPNELQQAPARAEPKPVAPEWTKRAEPPPATKLEELQKLVDAAPRDRARRNAYAEALVQSERWDALQALAFQWLPFDPENAQVFEFLGKSATNLGDPKTALRAFSSIAELAPSDAALLDRAGWLMLVAKEYGYAVDLFRAALKQRGDHPNIHRGLALSLWLAGKHEDAAKAYEAALKVEFNSRYGDVKRVLNEELGYVCRAWRDAWWATQPKESDRSPVNPAIQFAAKLKLDLERTDALRVTVAWETDANDVDLHVVDPSGEECFYSHTKNAGGLELYSDQTQGLGPEVIRTAKAAPGVYHVGVKYYNAGPMGVSRGVVVVFVPQDGIVTAPAILPFCLVPNEEEVRFLNKVEVK
ncbi:MAG: hypothetical protein L6R28_05885 [Planctomycetes bacterium]|nr:hypothetical protein [Planctomycetota bacterium]